MKIVRDEVNGEVVGIELTRRNLTTLLGKLDYNRSTDSDEVPSLSMILQERVYVKAVEDAEHYADRAPGEMLDNTTGLMY